MSKRVVVKIGSNVLTRTDGKTDVTRISSLVDQVVWMRRHGYQVILVSSGAVSCGRDEYHADRKLDHVRQRQLFSAIGQVKLVGLYYDLFREYGVTVGQVLTMKESFSTRVEYLTQRQCMEVMLDNGVLPIVNENDTVSVTELMFTDNDELSGLVATMTDSDALVILSNIDGIYTGDPADQSSTLIRRVDADSEISACILSTRSSMGRGGMTTKYRIARKVAAEGIAVAIANGKRDAILTDLLLGDSAATPHTLFVPAERRPSSLRKWIAHSDTFAKGTLHVDDGAARALRAGGASLLAVGVTAADGDFERDDIVCVAAPDGSTVAWGRTAYSAAEVAEAIGRPGLNPVIHADYLYVDENDVFRDK